MKTRQLIKGLGGALVAAALVFSLPASADTQLIHFDDAPNNGFVWYSTADRNFLFDPTNMQSGNCADSTNGGNGSCLIEVEQGTITTMTRPEVQTTQQYGNNSDPAPDASGELAFTLDAFYFLLTGVGKDPENSITVTGYDAAGVQTHTHTFSLDGTYDGPGDPVVTFYEGGGAAGALVHNIGYVATLGSLFEGVYRIDFTSHIAANVRLDCIVATHPRATTEPLSGFTGGCGGGSNVPEPGTVALLGLGLVGMGLMRRRRKV